MKTTQNTNETINAAKKARSIARAAVTRANKTGDAAKIQEAAERLRAAELAYEEAVNAAAADSSILEDAPQAADDQTANAATNEEETGTPQGAAAVTVTENAADSSDQNAAPLPSEEEAKEAANAAVFTLCEQNAAKISILEEKAEAAAKVYEAKKAAAREAEDLAKTLRRAATTEEERAEAKEATDAAKYAANERDEAERAAEDAKEELAAAQVADVLNTCGEDLIVSVRFKTPEEAALETVAALAEKKEAETVAPYKTALDTARAAVEAATDKETRREAVEAEKEAAAELRKVERKAAQARREETRAAKEAAEIAKETAPRVAFTFGVTYTDAVQKRPSAALQAAHNAAALAMVHLSESCAAKWARETLNAAESTKARTEAERREYAVACAVAAFADETKGEVSKTSAHFNAAGRPENIMAAARCIAKKVAAHSVEKQGTPTQIKIDLAARCGDWTQADLADMVAEAASTIHEAVAASREGFRFERLRREARETGKAAAEFAKLATADRAARCEVLNSYTERPEEMKYRKNAAAKDRELAKEAAEGTQDKEEAAAKREEVRVKCAKLPHSYLEEAKRRYIEAVKIAAEKGEVFEAVKKRGEAARTAFIAASVDGSGLAKARAAEKETKEALAATKREILENAVEGKEAVKAARAALEREREVFEKRRGEAIEAAKADYIEKAEAANEAAKIECERLRAANEEAVAKVAAVEKVYKDCAAEMRKMSKALRVVENMRKTDPRRAFEVFDDVSEKTQEAEERANAAKEAYDEASRHAAGIAAKLEAAESRARFAGTVNAAEVEEAAEHAVEVYKARVAAAEKEYNSCAAKAREEVLSKVAAAVDEMKEDGAKEEEIKNAAREAFNDVLAENDKEGRLPSARAAVAKATKERAVAELKFREAERAAGEVFDNSREGFALKAEYEEAAAEKAKAEGNAAKERKEYFNAAKFAANVSAPTVSEDTHRTKARAEVLQLTAYAAAGLASASTLEEKAKAAEKVTRAAYRRVNNYLAENRGVREDAAVAPLSWEDLANYEADPRLIIGDDTAANHEVIRRDTIRAAYKEFSITLTAAQKTALRALYKTAGNERAAARAAGVDKKTIYKHAANMARDFAAAVMKAKPKSMEARELGLLKIARYAAQTKAEAEAVAAKNREKIDRLRAAEALKHEVKNAARIEEAEAKIREAEKTAKNAGRRSEHWKAAAAAVSGAGLENKEKRGEIADAVKKAFDNLPPEMKANAAFLAKNPKTPIREAARILGKNHATLIKSKKRAAKIIGDAIIEVAPHLKDAVDKLVAAGDIAMLLNIAA